MASISSHSNSTGALLFLPFCVDLLNGLGLNINWGLGLNIYLGPGTGDSTHLSGPWVSTFIWDSIVIWDLGLNTHLSLVFLLGFCEPRTGHLFRFGTYFLSTLVFLNLQSVKGSPNQSTTLISNKSPKNLERDFVCQYKVFLVLIFSPSYIYIEQVSSQVLAEWSF